MKFQRTEYNIETINKAVKEYYDTNLSAHKIALKYGITKNVIMYHFHKPIKTKKLRNKIDIDIKNNSENSDSHISIGGSKFITIVSPKRQGSRKKEKIIVEKVSSDHKLSDTSISETPIKQKNYKISDINDPQFQF